MLFHWQSDVLAAFLLVCLLLGVGYVYQLIGEANDLRRESAPGRMVHIGGHRLHLLSRGEEGPAVIIEQGAGELSRFWWKLQDKISAFAQVCTYDRAGYGWSEPAGKSQTIEQRVRELRTLLQNAGVVAPYLFVAHSYGGLIVRGYAQAHPSEVAGLVLVDTPEESAIFNPDVLSFYAKLYWINRVIGLAANLGLLRFLRHWIKLDKYGIWLTRRSEFRALCDDLLSIQRVPDAQRSSRTAGSLGSLPVIAISHGQPFPGPFAVLETNWSDGQQRLAALSSNSQLILSQKSNHMIHDDDPEIVITSILRIVEAIRTGKPLADSSSPTKAEFVDESEGSLLT